MTASAAAVGDQVPVAGDALIATDVADRATDVADTYRIESGQPFTTTGAYFGWQTRKDQDRLDDLNGASADHDYADAEDVIDRGRRNALLANLSFAAAAITSGVGVYFVVTPRQEESPVATVAPAVQAGLVWSRAF